jgi:molybdenum cofactor cytidylyltransferase
MASQPHVAAIVLAAGRSTRMGEVNKLLAPIGDKPMVRRVVEVALASAARPVVVVTGHEGAQVARALEGLSVSLVFNPAYARGLSTSLVTGIDALPGDCEAVLVMLGDMPHVRSTDLDALIGAFGSGDPPPIVVPTHAGRRGNPVLWPARYFGEMRQLKGDAGAKSLLVAHAGDIKAVELDTSAVLADVDTPEALARARAFPLS